MKYDILFQTFTSSLVRKQYLPKKSAFFSPKIGEFFFVKISFKLKKERKKVAWTTKQFIQYIYGIGLQTEYSTRINAYTT